MKGVRTLFTRATQCDLVEKTYCQVDYKRNKKKTATGEVEVVEAGKRTGEDDSLSWIK